MTYSLLEYLAIGVIGIASVLFLLRPLRQQKTSSCNRCSSACNQCHSTADAEPDTSRQTHHILQHHPTQARPHNDR